MKSAVRIIARDRAPLERRRKALLDELDAIDALLGDIGRLSAQNAAYRYIEENPGCLTEDVVAASGVDQTRLSHMKKWGWITNDGRRGPGVKTRWWAVKKGACLHKSEGESG